MPEPTAAIRIPPDACTIGPARMHRFAGPQQLRLRRPIGRAMERENAVYSAHRRATTFVSANRINGV